LKMAGAKKMHPTTRQTPTTRRTRNGENLLPRFDFFTGVRRNWLLDSSVMSDTPAGDAVPGPLGFCAFGRQQAHRTSDAPACHRPTAAFGLLPGRALSSAAALAEYFGPPWTARTIRQSTSWGRPAQGGEFRSLRRAGVLRGSHKRPPHPHTGVRLPCGSTCPFFMCLLPAQGGKSQGFGDSVPKIQDPLAAAKSLRKNVTSVAGSK
jgi:hypothetical protein